MNKYQQKLERIKARRISIKQRLLAFVQFVYFVIVGLWIIPFGLMAINIFYEDYALIAVSAVIKNVITAFCVILVVSLFYMSFKMIGHGLKYLTLFLSGVTEKKMDSHP